MPQSLRFSELDDSARHARRRRDHDRNPVVMVIRGLRVRK